MINDLWNLLKGQRREGDRAKKSGALSMKRKEGVENTCEMPLDSENIASVDFEEP